MTYAEQRAYRPRFEQIPLHAVPVSARRADRKRVLNVCMDRTLLQTRTAVLKAAGFRPIAANTLASAAKALAARQVQAVVMCHTISEHDREALVQVVRKRCARARVIALSNGYALPQHGVDATIESHDGPEALIQALRSR